jgi:hypothetical protein
MNKTNINIPCPHCQDCDNLVCIECGGSGVVPLETTFKHVCLVCNKELRLTDGFVLDGSELKITVGYGSEHDGDVFEGYICDTCITAKEKDDTIRFTENYMYPQVTTKMYKEITKRELDK